MKIKIFYIVVDYSDGSAGVKFFSFRPEAEHYVDQLERDGQYTLSEGVEEKWLNVEDYLITE